MAQVRFGPRLADLVRFFGPLYRRIAELPLTGFAYLSPDRLLQRARFGDDVEVIANFADETRGGVRGGCLEVRAGGVSRGETYCP